MNKYLYKLRNLLSRPRYTLLDGFDYGDYENRHFNTPMAPYREPVESEVDLLTRIFPPIFPNWKVYVKTFDRIEDPQGSVIRFEMEFWRSAFESFEDPSAFAGVHGILKDDGGWFCGWVGGNYVPMSSYEDESLESFWPRDLGDLTAPRFSPRYFTSRRGMRSDWLGAFSERYKKMYEHLGPAGVLYKSKHDYHRARMSETYPKR